MNAPAPGALPRAVAARALNTVLVDGRNLTDALQGAGMVFHGILQPTWHMGQDIRTSPQDRIGDWRAEMRRADRDE